MKPSQDPRNPQETGGSLIPTFNLNTLSPRRIKEARTLFERETMQYFNQRLDVERVTALTCDAIKGHVLLSQMADAAIEISPRSANRIDALLGAHANYCYNKILDADDWRDRR